MYKDDEIGIEFDNFNVNDELKLFEDCISHPTKIIIRLFIKHNVLKSGLIIDNSKDVYNEMVGYVAKLGTHCFKGNKYEGWGNWYKLGDWVVFPRHSGIRLNYKKLPIFSISDDAPLFVVNDPREVK
jgi:hypothetical protein